MQADGKKKLVQINTVCNTSTGRIMGDIQREAIRQGYETISFVGRRKAFEDIPCEKIGNPFSFWLHVAITTAFDRHGYGSGFVTEKIVQRIREEKPDIIHLHNLHGYYLNLPVLFRYLTQEYQGKVFWTFHDCWPFTGHCAYFTMAGCEKWKKKCMHCPNKTVYPISLFADASERNYVEKQKMFCGLSDLTIITPSVWMKNLVSESFFKQYPIEVVPNGIDRDTFSYTEDEALYEKYGIPKNKKIILGVANIWDRRKGLNDFLELSGKLPEEYRIVLVGLSQGQIRRLPDRMIGIERTQNQKELAALYSLAEVFVNPSLEESFSLVTVEAFACGTPVIVLDTSAVKELVTPQNGFVLSAHGPQEYLAAVRKLESLRPDRKTVARTAQKYDKNRVAAEMIRLYEKKDE